jgi:orotidine-5'-phosphate decarboxylase
MQQPASPIVLALDTPHLGEARAWAAASRGSIGMVKVGLELFGAHGPGAVRALRADGHRVMLDLKLHDIPATVGGAVAALAPLGAELLTVHAGGGRAMLGAALETAGGRTLIAAVTVLTSLDQDDLDALGLGQASMVAERLAGLALEAGCRALVCSPLEVARLRALAGPDVTLVCPGVRPAAEPGMGQDPGGRAPPGRGRTTQGPDDQARVAAPAAALAGGADLLVVGRPITRAPDPAAAARAVNAEALRGLPGGPGGGR